MVWRELGADVGDELFVAPRRTSLDAGIYSFSETFYSRWGKPLFDRVTGLIALIAVSPVLLLIATAVWLAMDSPIFFDQERVGRRGKVFRMWKFRTMAPDRRANRMEWIGPERRRTHKSAEDPRISALGRFLRATRIDELPQLINVVTGELSLVGPRPELVDIVAEYELWQHRRHAIKPGVTGLWQISDTGDALLRECTEMELQYLDQVSLRSDLKIILRTLPAMVRRAGI